MSRYPRHFVLVLVGLLLCVLLCAPLTGCAKTPAPAAQPGLGYAELLATVMQTSEGGIGDHLTYCSIWNVIDGRIWACGNWRDADAPQNDRQNLLVSATQENDDVNCLQLTLPTAPWQPKGEQSANRGVTAILRAPDGGVRLLVEYFLLRPVTVGEEVFVEYLQHQYDLCTVGTDGTLQPSATLQFPEEWQAGAEEGEMISLNYNNALITPDGDLWLLVMRSRQAEDHKTATDISWWLVQFAPDGSCKSDTMLGGDDSHMTSGGLLPDGSLLLYELGSGTTSGMWLLKVDIAAEGGPVTERLPLPEDFLGNWTNDIVGQSEDGRPLLWNTNGLFALDETLTKVERLLDWADYDLDPYNIRTLLALDGGRFLAVTGQEKLRFHRLQPMTPEMLAGREVITLGVSDSGAKELKAAVRDYNFTEPGVYIQTVDYSDIAATAAGYDSGTAMLYDHILKNTAPDILLLPNDIGAQNLVGKGLFIDLAPYLDADSELRRADLVPGLLAACQDGEALPTVIPAFSFITAAASPATLGETPGWTWEEYNAACAAAPDLQAPFFPFDRGTMLHWLVQLGGSAFLDYPARQCHFDTPEFVSLLAASATWPAQGQDMASVDSREVFRQGQSLAFVYPFTDFSALPMLRYALDGDLVLKGLPSDSGSGAAFSAMLRLGITRDCKDPDAAWAFLRTLLLPDFQGKLKNGLPLRLDALQQAAEAAAQPQQLQKSLGFLRDDLSEEQLAVWQQTAAADCDKLLAAIQDATALFQYDGAIVDILAEEAEAFYNGVRTAEQAAAIIQGRVQTYLDEQS